MNWLVNFRMNVRCWPWRRVWFGSYTGMWVGANGRWACHVTLCSLLYRGLSTRWNLLQTMKNNLFNKLSVNI